MPPKLPFAAVLIPKIGGLWHSGLITVTLIKNVVIQTGLQSWTWVKDATVLCVDWAEEMKGLAAFIDDHCIGLPGEELALQATNQRRRIL